jgi:hypothetical protein
VKTEKDYEEFLALLNKHEIWREPVTGPYGQQTINDIDRQNLIESKKLSDRIQDKADLELLLSDT